MEVLAASVYSSVGSREHSATMGCGFVARAFAHDGNFKRRANNSLTIAGPLPCPTDGPLSRLLKTFVSLSNAGFSLADKLAQTALPAL